MAGNEDKGMPFGEIACMAIGAVIGIAILKSLRIGGAVGGGLGGLLGALVGSFVYSSLFKQR